MIKQIRIGFSSYANAIKFIRKNGLAWFYLVPLVINIGLFYGGFLGTDFLTDKASHWIISIIGMEEGGEYYQMASSIIWWFVMILLKIVLFFVLHFIGGGLVLAMLSPILAYLSERTDKIISGHDYPFSFTKLCKDIIRGVLIATRNTFIQLFFMIVFLFFALIPVIGWLAPFIMFLIAAYYYGFTFMDYSCERKRLTMSESIKFIRKNKGLAISNGTMFSLMIMVPWIGSTLAGFVAIISVVAATLSIHVAEEQKLLR